jgi:biotin carboxyl carrier protein
MKKLRVTVDGKVFEVLVESLDSPQAQGSAPQAPAAFQQTSVAPPPSSAPKASAAPAGAGSVASPLAGRIVSIDCQVGQAVAAGTQLATVEAMKMNTFVYAEQAGTVAAILVNAGDAVEEGQALVSLS